MSDKASSAGNAAFGEAEWLRAKEVFFKRNPLSIVERLLAKRNRFPRVLDCGTGIGSVIRALAPQIDYDEILGIDMNPDLVEIAEQELAHLPNCHVRQGDVQALDSLPDGTFDLVTSQELIEHVPNPVQALREMWRVLKPGGILLCLRNADTEIFFAPESNVQVGLDEKIIGNFNMYLLHQKRATAPRFRTDNRCGRKLPYLAVEAGLSNVEVTISPWYIYPSPGLAADEQRVLRMVVEMFAAMSTDKGVKSRGNELGLEAKDFVNPGVLDLWKRERLGQIDQGELSFFVNYFSLSAMK